MIEKSSLFRKSKKEVIVVSGLPRSGTSLMMQMLEAGGMPVLCDGVREHDDDNPKGYYEFERVKKLKTGDTAWVMDAVGKAVKVVTAHLEYLPDGYSYRVILMDRPLEEVLMSQDKMLRNRGERKKVADEEMGEIFAKHLQETREWMKERPNFDFTEVDFKSAIRSPQSVVDVVCDFLGRDLDRDKMAAVVDPELYRSRVANLQNKIDEGEPD